MGKKKVLSHGPVHQAAKKQRNKRWVCVWEPEYMPEFFGAAYQPLKDGGPNMTFALTPFRYKTGLTKPRSTMKRKMNGASKQAMP